MLFNCRTLLFCLVSVLLLPACKLTSDESISETSVTGSSSDTPAADFTIVADNSTPPPPNDEPVVLPPPDLNPNDSAYEEGFFINSNSKYTNKDYIDLSFNSLAPSKIKIGRSLNCSDGAWENYISEQRIVLQDFNQPLTYSVQFEDWEGSRSPCYRRSITHDNIGPEIVLQTYPATSIELGTSSEISFLVRDDRSEMINVNCKLNLLQKPCFKGNNKAFFSELPIGTYTFTVTAMDDLMNVTTKTVVWTVQSSFKKVVQKVTVDNYKKVDVLFVIDNSGSMAYEQQSMGQRTSHFLSILQGLDYQIAVTTTDPRNINLGDGRLVPITGGNGLKIIDSTMQQASAQDLLSRTLQRSETGSGSEEGIRAVYRTVERYAQNESDLRSFLRSDAQLSVVLISDEDESANTNKNDPAQLLNLINATWAGQKRFNFNSIITRPGDTACLTTYGATYGARYQSMSNMTGGVIGNVCAMDYTAQVVGIADEIKRLLKTLTLSCSPLSQFVITIKKDNQVVTQEYTIEGLNIKFTKELDPGNYEIEYTCLK